MGWGNGNLGGGGGASLNFDVKYYETKEALLASTPNKYTIGIITTTPITSWVFSATDSIEPQEGKVLISTGTSSTVEFNALKKNGIQVYPISAKQYINGVWVNKTAMSYQGGKWVNWLKTENFLYYRGSFYNDQKITEQYNSGCTYTLENDKIHIYAGEYIGNAVYLYFNPISFSGKTKLIVRAKSNGNFRTSGGSEWMCGFAVSATTSTDPVWNDPHANRLTLTAGEKIDLTLDVSAINDTRYVVIRASCSGGTGLLDVDIYEVEVS